MEDSPYVQVEIAGVGHDFTGKPLVVLRDASDHNRQLPIWIGHCEALAIAQRLREDFDPPRPLTHDLAVAMWKRLGAELRQLRIDDLWQKVYYSKLSFAQGEQTVDIDCRPSDGIALALTAGVPIYVADRVMQEGGLPDVEP